MVASENLWFFCVFRGYKIGKLATEAFISSGILTTARSQCFHFISLKISENQGFLVFWECIKWGHWPKMGLKKDWKLYSFRKDVQNIWKLLSQKISFNLVHRLLASWYKNSGKNHFGIGSMYSILCAALIRALCWREKLFQSGRNEKH